MVELHAPPLPAAGPPPDPAQLDAIFHALSDSTRRAMLGRLSDGGACSIGELAAPFAMSFAAASKHVKVLEGAGLVRRQVKGRRHYCQLDAAMLRQAERWIQERRAMWEQSFDRLDAVLAAAAADMSATPDEGDKT